MVALWPSYWVGAILLAFRTCCFVLGATTECLYELRHDKTNKVSVRRAKTQINLGIRPVWSESSLSAWRKLGSLATKWAHSEDWSDWADLSLRWAHTHFVGFAMSRLIFFSFGCCKVCRISLIGSWSLPSHLLCNYNVMPFHKTKAIEILLATYMYLNMSIRVWQSNFIWPFAILSSKYFQHDISNR